MSDDFVDDEPDEYPGMGRLETPIDVDDEIQRLAHRKGTDQQRLGYLQTAYAMLPVPRTAYYDSLWLLRDISEYQCRLGDHAAACTTLRTLLAEMADAALAPGVCVTLGKSMMELGEPGAFVWLWLANLLCGRDEFLHANPKYWAIVEQIQKNHEV